MPAPALTFVQILQGDGLFTFENWKPGLAFSDYKTLRNGIECTGFHGFCKKVEVRLFAALESTGCGMQKVSDATRIFIAVSHDGTPFLSFFYMK